MSSFVCAFLCFVFGKVPFQSWTALFFYRKKWNYDCLESHPQALSVKRRCGRLNLNGRLCKNCKSRSNVLLFDVININGIRNEC